MPVARFHTFLLGVIAVVLTVTALASGVVERSPLSFPLMFLGLGFLLGGRGLDMLEISPHSAVLEVVATLTLALVLFLDAVKLQITELGKRWVVPALILGPGTGLIIVIGALPLGLYLNVGWIIAFIGGAVLASTDPVVLRDIVRDERIPRSVRQVLKIEAGMNDLIVLPVVLVLIAVANDEGSSFGGWSVFLVKLLLLGPAIGLAIGGLGSWLMNRIDAKMPIRSEHQALFGVGLVLAPYSAAAAAGGDGFLGAFAAGLGVVVFNQSLCDCFLEYGETTSEMAMLLAFVLFGVVLSGILADVDVVPALVLAALVVAAGHCWSSGHRRCWWFKMVYRAVRRPSMAVPPPRLVRGTAGLQPERPWKKNARAPWRACLASMKAKFRWSQPRSWRPGWRSRTRHWWWT